MESGKLNFNTLNDKEDNDFLSSSINYSSMFTNDSNLLFGSQMISNRVEN